MNPLAYISLEKILRAISSFVLMLLLARALGPTEFGVFSLILTIVFFAGAVVSLGLKDIVIDSASKGRYASRALARTSRSAQLLAALFVAPIYFAILFLSVDLTGPQAVATAIIFLIIPSTAYFTHLFCLEGRSNVIDVAKINVAGVVVGIILKSLVLVWDVNILTVSAAYLSEYLCIALLSYISYVFRKDTPQTSVDILSMRDLLRRGMPLMFSSIAVMGYMYCDQLMLFAMNGAAEVGMYAAATRVSFQLTIIPVILSILLIPVIARRHHAGTDVTAEMSLILSLYLVCGVLAVAIAYLVSDPVFSLLLGSEYAASPGIFRIHLAGLLFAGLNIITARFYILHGLERLSFLRQLFGLSINIILNFVLIPPFGARGAAMAFVISHVAILFIFDAFHPETRFLYGVKLKAFRGLFQARALTIFTKSALGENR